MTRRAVTLLEMIIVVCIIALLAALLIPPFHKTKEVTPEEPAQPTTMEARIDLGGGWTGRISVLPTGERILLTYLYHSNGHGGQISTSAVLLPALPSEKR